MDNERRKAKKFVIGLFLCYLFIALACFGFAAYTVFMSRRGEPVSSWMVDITKIIVMIGIFFLVLAFGYILPALISRKNANAGKGDFGIFDETIMRQALEKYIPNGETLLAGVHAISKETNITGVFGKCVRTENRLIPDENGSYIAINKKKYSAYDVYIGITQYSLVITECEMNSYAYQIYDKPDVNGADIQEVTSDIFFGDIGTCFPLADIQSCQIKNGWMGSVKCFITMKNGSYFKLMIPKFGGLGGGMPHYTEYREAIIARLSGN